MKERSYANAESSDFKRIRLDRVHRLARVYGLGTTETAELVAGWEALPASPYNQRMEKPWSERNARRGKARAHDGLKLRLLEMTTLLVANIADPGSLCTCSGEIDMFADPMFTEASSGQCELCEALRALGVAAGWTTSDDVVAALAKIQEGMTG